MATPTAYRPFQLYGDINVIDHTLYSNYHSWQNLLSRQTGTFSFTAAYTFSKALGIRGGQQGRAIQPPDLSQLRDYSVRRPRQRPPTHLQRGVQLAAARGEARA